MTSSLYFTQCCHQLTMYICHLMYVFMYISKHEFLGDRVQGICICNLERHHQTAPQGKWISSIPPATYRGAFPLTATPTPGVNHPQRFLPILERKRAFYSRFNMHLSWGLSIFSSVFPFWCNVPYLFTRFLYQFPCQYIETPYRAGKLALCLYRSCRNLSRYIFLVTLLMVFCACSVFMFI